MFDRYNIQRSSPPADVKVEVKITDPSVVPAAKLLDDVTTRATQSVRDAILVDVPSIEARYVKYAKSINNAAMLQEHYIAYNINGWKFEKRIPRDYWQDKDGYALKVMAEALAVEILRDLMQRGSAAEIDALSGKY